VEKLGAVVMRRIRRDKFTVKGADPATAKEVTMTVRAADRRSAELIAAERGILVSEVRLGGKDAMPRFEQTGEVAARSLHHTQNAIVRAIELPANIAMHRGRGRCTGVRILCWLSLILLWPMWLILLAWAGSLKNRIPT